MTLTRQQARAIQNRTGISISDIVNVEAIVTRAGGNVDDIMFRFNVTTGEYEAFVILLPGIPVARYDPMDGWVAP